MQAYELIKKKRDGGVLEPAEIAWLIDRYTRGEVGDYQMSALCMAVWFRGMTSPELAAWTSAMLRSGETADLSDIPGAKVDKHSTGGVGDKVTLTLAPLAAACGVKVPMISGRGLGHTGGTLDKLQSIPGFKVDLPIARYRELVRDVGACLIGQTDTLAPADKKLYALRDVTATVDCLPLIAASILSKKLAEGIDALVLDVKVGSGAFMKTLDDARRLGATMVELGQAMGKQVVACLTDMSQPLGRAVGNRLEVMEALEFLEGAGPEDLRECTLVLTGRMLTLAGVARDESEARERMMRAVADGSAIAKFEEIVRAQGGDLAALRHLAKNAPAPVVESWHAPCAGYVAAIDTEAVGLAAVALGAGRARLDSPIDPAVGFVFEKKRGDRVEEGEPVVTIHAATSRALEQARRALFQAIAFAPAPPEPVPLVLGTV